MNKAKGVTKGPLILVDGSSYLYRAFHAMPQLANSHGEPTGAVYGMTNMLRRLLAQYDPAYIAVVFDAKGETFREQMFADYKANRPPMPDELAIQIGSVHSIVRAMGLPLLIVEGVEADDVIATLAARASAAGMNVLISTGDKDMTQLVGDRVTLINTMTDTRYDKQAVAEKFGVPPERIVDYLALIGDSVDNIPGVPKVGPKTAVRWLKRYGSLEGVITHAGEIEGKVGENLRATLEQLPLSRALATVKRDVPLEQEAGDLKRASPDETKLRELYTRLEFQSLLAELPPARAAAAVGSDETANAYETILDEVQLDTWLARLRASELFALDTETTDLDAMRAVLVGV
ncbi:MAG: 5'-3' exonuclease H3TH domain-containing protein, partial [Acidiferrobacterales bacterium]